MTTKRSFRRSPRRSTGPRRKTSWEQFIFSDLALLASGAILVADLTPEPVRTGGTSHRGGIATIVRALLHFDLSAEATSTEVQGASVGIAVYSHEAATGPTVMDPNSDPTQDWYYWTSRVVRTQSGGDLSVTSWDVDIRSSRKLRGGYDFLMTMAGRSTNEVTLQLQMSMRLLWKIG